MGMKLNFFIAFVIFIQSSLANRKEKRFNIDNSQLKSDPLGIEHQIHGRSLEEMDFLQKVGILWNFDCILFIFKL